MPPVLLALDVLQFLIQEYPSIKSDIQVALSKENPTTADWAALRLKIQSDTFAKLAPDAPLE